VIRGWDFLLIRGSGSGEEMRSTISCLVVGSGFGVFWDRLCLSGELFFLRRYLATIDAFLLMEGINLDVSTMSGYSEPFKRFAGESELSDDFLKPSSPSSMITL